MLNNFKLYRKLRGGIWLQLFDGSSKEYWKRLPPDSTKYTEEDILLEIEIYILVSIKGRFIQFLMDLYKNVSPSHHNKLSDGYHTFGELYDHRFALFLCLLNAMHISKKDSAWKSRKNADGGHYPGWFVAGINDRITYHLPEKYWDMALVPEKENGLWDKHTSFDVIDRLLEMSQYKPNSYRLFIERNPNHFYTEGALICSKNDNSIIFTVTSQHGDVLYANYWNGSQICRATFDVNNVVSSPVEPLLHEIATMLLPQFGVMDVIERTDDAVICRVKDSDETFSVDRKKIVVVS
jgi:hypothetical protein